VLKDKSLEKLTFLPDIAEVGYLSVGKVRVIIEQRQSCQQIEDLKLVNILGSI
jgi:hypothetical protein